MIVFSEDSPQRQSTPSARENHASTEAARALGCRIYYIPEDFSRCETAENALSYVPEFENIEPAVWIGFIPTPERYREIYEAALRRGVRLLNSPEEHLNAQEFDRSYPLLGELTPESMMVRNPDECARVVEKLGLPLFLKGAVQSRKSRGWKACVADTLEEAERLTEALLSLEGRTRGRVALRKLERLKFKQKSPEGFPFGREYRVFLFGQRVLGWSYYWEGDDPLEELSPDEEVAVLKLAKEAARRVGSPFVSIDIGQTEDDRWIVIESGDAQFSGYSKIPVWELWNQITRIDSAELALVSSPYETT